MAVLIQGWLHHRRWADAAYRVRFPREVVRVREPQVAKALAVTIAMLDERSRPGEAIYIYPINPVFYFLTGRENPTSTERLLPFYDSPQQHDRIFSELEKADPRLKAILVFNIDFPMYLKQYPSVPAAEFEQIVRGFEKRMQDRFGDRVLHPPF
jgi:hypothetical protein